jgi:hypothetical protein
VLKRIPWQSLPASFRDDVERYTQWASMPEPLAEGARVRALSPRTLRLQQQHIHSAASAAVATGMSVGQLTSLATLVQPGTFRAVLGHLWQHDGRKLSAYTHGIAITLTAIASEWVKMPAEVFATLKGLRKKLGALPSGLTLKNQVTLRTFADPRLVAELVRLPDRLWHQARRMLPKSKGACRMESGLAPAASTCRQETDCMPGHVGFELRCAERKFISLTSRASLDLGDMVQTVASSRENDLLH